MNNLFNNIVSAAKTSTLQYLSGNSTNDKESTLRSQLHHCTYTDDVKFVMQKAIKQVFHVYPCFSTDILTFTENGKQKRFIQIKGILEIEIKGKICKVDYNMMLPNAFPKKPPYVRIINRNNFMVHQMYKSLKSPNDEKSFVLNPKLKQVEFWDPSKSIVNVIIQSYDMMRMNFPFTKSQKQENYGYGQKSQSKSKSGWNSPWQQITTNIFDQKNQNFQNQGYKNSQNNTQNFPKKSPIPFNNISQTIAFGQKFAGQSRKKLQNLKSQHLKAVQNLQNLDIILNSLRSEQNYLRQQNFEMTQFLQKTQENPVDNVASSIITTDELSEQILDLISSSRSREDCINLIQTKFNEGDIGLEDFIKNIRRIEQLKFDQKVLLAKCISVKSGR